MEPIIDLTPDPEKKLCDYPRISACYTLMPKHLLDQSLKEMKVRAKTPTNDWEIKFAHLHVEAMENEIRHRNA